MKKGLYEDIIAVVIILILTCMFYSCIDVTPPLAPVLPVVTATPSPSPQPTVVKTQQPFGVTMPDKVSQGEKFRVTFNSDEDTWVSIWVDQKYPMGDMRWDSGNKIKYLDIKLDTRGTRQIWFRVNDIYVYFKTIEVVP